MTATDPVTGADPDQAAPAVIGDPWTMPDPFAAIVSHLIDGDREAGPAIALDLTRWLGNHPEPASGTGLASLAAAFLVSLAGPDHPLLERAEAILATPPGDAPPELVELFRTASAAVPREVAERRTGDRHFSQALADAGSLLDGHPLGRRVARDAIWSVLYPEAAGLFGDIDGAIAALRRRRIVERIEPNPHPITDAAREVLFTSNVLLGLPLDGPGIPAPGLDPEIAAGVARARAGSQQHWFDHPIPIGVDTAANELLHGLRGLDAAMAAEPGAAAQPGFAAGSPGALPLRRLTCLLSVSVTHDELHEIARRCVELDLATIDPLPHLDILVASETDVRRLVEEVLLPAISTFASAGSEPGPAPRLAVLGVDGEYGRHYSFLKAIAAIWQVFVDPAVRGTFKIDLDQVFPQSELVVQTGRTALQHLETPLWGGHGRDSDGRRVELGMVAGALVNAGDIERGLFTADITVPAEPARASEWVFFSPLPQAISTQAEMLERYDTAMPDGVETALERIHVTGGTNGILVEALRRYRPFTPSFIGRAEDQAYILSTLGDQPRLAYVHAAGLVMRHDKDAYAGAAIEAARVGKMVGDDVRILAFSSYARTVARSRAAKGLSVESIKSLLDPFTGGFISRLPVTTVTLRFALRILEAFAGGDAELGRAYATIGSRRLLEALALATDQDGLQARLDDERAQWRHLYDALDAIESALAAGNSRAIELQRRARELIEGWRVRPSGRVPASGSRSRPST